MKKLLLTIKSDIYRYAGRISFLTALRCYLRIPAVRFLFWHRIANFTRLHNRILYFFVWFIHRRLTIKYGFDIPAETQIGKGFYIGHFGGIVVSARAVIGSNVNISQGVTIGKSSRGRKKGYPVIKDGVYIAPGAVIIGNIIIGENVAIGANAVVIEDVPDNAVVVGNPALIVSSNGSEGYILNKAL